ncbi:MAG TPA: hypothetical protein VFW45_15790 [Candidatus Polarisedimenticolia bacterium]|nr:hypothetical protein [Candidatus Polarisedimenticolia bacterium]
MTNLDANDTSRPGIGAALIAFAIFAGICAGSIAVARRHGTLYDDIPPGDRSAETSRQENVEAHAIMREARYSSDSQAFRSAELVAIAGRGVLDLSAAKMKGDSGRLEVVVIAGAAVVKVPPDWAVMSADNVAAAGAIENYAKKAEGSEVKKVHLEAFVLAGRIEVVH